MILYVCVRVRVVCVVCVLVLLSIGVLDQLISLVSSTRLWHGTRRVLVVLLSSIPVVFPMSCVGPCCMKMSTRSLGPSLSHGTACACPCYVAHRCSCRYAFVPPCMRLVSSAIRQLSSWPLTLLSRHLNVLLFLASRHVCHQFLLPP